MCQVMRHVMVPQDFTIFDYESLGDLFYMLIKGSCHVKVPFARQFVWLSEAEKLLLEQEYNDDLLSMALANEKAAANVGQSSIF